MEVRAFLLSYQRNTLCESLFGFTELNQESSHTVLVVILGHMYCAAKRFTVPALFHAYSSTKWPD